MARRLRLSGRTGFGGLRLVGGGSRGGIFDARKRRPIDNKHSVTPRAAYRGRR